MKRDVIISRAVDTEPVVLDTEEVRGVEKRVMIGRASDAPNFFMRLFTVRPEGHSPLHRHHWEHEVFIVNGTVTVVTESGEHIAEEGTSVFVPSGVLHQFRNESSEVSEFICVVPSTGEE